MTARKLLLIDTSALIHRAYYASMREPRFNASGEQTNAVYGFYSMLFGIIDREQPDYLALAFEGGYAGQKNSTFRHKLYPAYKAQRTGAPPELLNQIPRVQEVAIHLGIPCFNAPGYEADDVIGMLTAQARGVNLADVVIATGDHDLLQLVNEYVTVLIPAHGKTFTDAIRYDPNEVQAAYGFAPCFLNHYKALAGDTADNIKGVPGIGPVAARELIKKYGTVWAAINIAEHTGSIFQTTGQKLLLKHKDEALASLALTTIVVDAGLTKVKLNLQNAAVGCHIDRPVVTEIFKELKLQNFLDRAFALGHYNQAQPQRPAPTIKFYCARGGNSDD